MGILLTIKEIIEILDETVKNDHWKDYDTGFEFTTIADFGGLRREFENSIVLRHYLNENGVDMKFDNIGTHFIKA